MIEPVSERAEKLRRGALHRQDLSEYISRMVEFPLSIAEQHELALWEAAMLDGRHRTSDWPGWRRLIGPRPHPQA